MRKIGSKKWVKEGQIYEEVYFSEEGIDLFLPKQILAFSDYD